jgi:hypothetical protein
VAIVEWDSLDDAVAFYKSKATPSVKRRDNLKVNGALAVEQPRVDSPPAVRAPPAAMPLPRR